MAFNQTVAFMLMQGHFGHNFGHTTNATKGPAKAFTVWACIYFVICIFESEHCAFFV